MRLAPFSCDEIAEPTAAIYPGVNMSCLVLVGCIASAGRPEKNPPTPDRTNLSPPRRPRSSPATMSPSAIFVFLLVSAVHMLECILDLKRRVGANCQENPALSFLSLVPDNSFGEKCFDFGWIDVVKNESSLQKNHDYWICHLLQSRLFFSHPCYINVVLTCWLMFQRGSISDDQLRLRVEITQLLKEASALST